MLVEASLEAKLNAYSRWQLPSFFGDLPSGIFVRGHELAPGWEQVLDRVVNESILPHFGPGKALRGVSLVTRSAAWMSHAGRAHCRLWWRSSGPFSGVIHQRVRRKPEPTGWGVRGPGPDRCRCVSWLSPRHAGSEEYARARAMDKQNVFPNPRSHRQLMLMPGVFASSNAFFYPLAHSSSINFSYNILRVGPATTAHCWIYALACHCNNRGSAQHPPPCDMRLGAVAIPAPLYFEWVTSWWESAIILCICMWMLSSR